jgi:hypothetical protein
MALSVVNNVNVRPHLGFAHGTVVGFDPSFNSPANGFTNGNARQKINHPSHTVFSLAVQGLTPISKFDKEPFEYQMVKYLALSRLSLYMAWRFSQIPCPSLSLSADIPFLLTSLDDRHSVLRICFRSYC